MGGETQYFLQVEFTLLAEQLSAALQRTSALRVRAQQNNERSALAKVLELERSLRSLQLRLRKLHRPEAAARIISRAKTARGHYRRRVAAE